MDSQSLWGIPEPCPIRLERYFCAKTGRLPEPNEAYELYKLFDHYGPDEVIFAMSTIPGYKLSVRKIKYALLSPDEREFYGLDDSQAELLPEESEKYGGIVDGKENVTDDLFDLVDDATEYDEGGNERSAWTTSDQIYDYSDFDPDALDSDEIFNELAFPDDFDDQ